MRRHLGRHKGSPNTSIPKERNHSQGVIAKAPDKWGWFEAPVGAREFLTINVAASHMPCGSPAALVAMLVSRPLSTLGYHGPKRRETHSQVEGSGGAAQIATDLLACHYV